MACRAFGLFTALLLVMLPAAARCPAAEANRPNFIVIFCDDLGYGDLRCYGATKVQTPNIDRLAKEGVMFWQACSPAPTCAPTASANKATPDATTH